MLRLDRLFRATAFRITCAYLGVFTLTILLVGAAIYFGVPWVWEARIHDNVETELETLLEHYEADGAPGLIGTLAERADELADDDFIVLLQNQGGEVLAGRLPASPVIEGWHEIAPPWRDDDEPYLGIGRLLPDGHYLVLGQDAEDLHDVVEFVEEGLIWTFVFALPLALIGGVLVSTITLRRVEAINRATRQIRGGDLSKRVPVVGTNDEFDRLAISINEMLDGIEDLTVGLRQVSQDIAHDLRTPLTRMRQKLELAGSQPGGPAASAGLVSACVQDLDELLEAFNALLRIGQIEAGVQKSKFSEIALSELVTSIADTFGSVAEDHGQTFRRQIEPGLVLKGDRQMLVQMLSNLVENAIRHAPAGAELSLALVREGEALLIVVADNGAGIPEAEREKVLRRFYRLEKSRTTAGSGLGLALVKAVTDLHGGSISLLDNQPGLRVELRFSN